VPRVIARPALGRVSILETSVFLVFLARRGPATAAAPTSERRLAPDPLSKS